MEGTDTSRAPVSTDCCGPSQTLDPRIAHHFNHKARRRLADGDAFDLAPVSRALLELLGSPAGASILEIGSGPGSLAMALLSAGAARYTGIDLALGPVELARRRTAEAGFADRVAFSQGDGAATTHEPHDWVVLDRAVCCYPDPDRLIANTAPAAMSRLAFSVPNSRGIRGILNRIWVMLENVTLPLRPDGCPGFVHDLRRIDRRLAGAGFHKVGERNAGLWHAALYERSPRPPRSVVAGAG